ncbi:MAG: hypothetical protein GF368_01185 [Candidatus Aenigmarchaeota archaeon]|nr:hypothetical protein [Candidatus Aenigmarchaeota archaeon]
MRYLVPEGHMYENTEVGDIVCPGYPDVREVFPQRVVLSLEENDRGGFKCALGMCGDYLAEGRFVMTNQGRAVEVKITRRTPDYQARRREIFLL